MRISDWSSDVCSSDLPCRARRRIRDHPGQPLHRRRAWLCRHRDYAARDPNRDRARVAPAPFEAGDPAGQEAREHSAVSHDEQETTPGEASEGIAAPAKPVHRVDNSAETPEDTAALVGVLAHMRTGGAAGPVPPDQAG